MRVSEIIAGANEFAGSQADKVNWRVGVTNDCRRIFEQYNVNSHGQCFEADTWQQARQAVRALIKQGFNGIDTGLPLDEFRFVFLYTNKAGERRAETPVSMPRQNDYKNTVLKPALATSTILTPHQIQSQLAAQNKIVRGVATVITIPVILVFLFGFVSFTTFLSDSDIADGPAGSSRGEQETGRDSPIRETPVLDSFLARFYICEERERHMLEVFGNEYELQRCLHTTEQEEADYAAFTVGRSSQVDWLLNIFSFNACEQPNRAALVALVGENFWIVGENFTHFDQASVTETERLHQQLVGDGLVQVELEPLCD